MGVPPTWVRRIVLAPLVIVAAIVMLVLTPIWLILVFLALIVAGARAVPRCPACSGS